MIFKPPNANYMALPGAGQARTNSGIALMNGVTESAIFKELNKLRSKAAIVILDVAYQ